MYDIKITKPTLLIDKSRAIANIKKMAQKAKKNNVLFRPHFKTHQSIEVGEWFKDFGVNSITVSSVEMAQYFASQGWNDITIAFPVNVLEIEAINKLASQIQLNLLVESFETVKFLEDRLLSSVNVWLKIDVGYHRTGIDFKKLDAIVELSKLIINSENLVLKGLLTHSGHSYHCRTPESIKQVFQQTVARLQLIKNHLLQQGLPDLNISIGDTPGCSIVDDFSAVDEIRPGNFVFYDLMQLQIGSCLEDDIAVAIACPVVAKHKERMEVIIHGGAVHFSKEYIVAEDGTKIYGYMAEFKENGWSRIDRSNYVKSLSQEHGIIHVNRHSFGKIKTGDIVLILPVHSCLAVDLMKNKSIFVLK